jgi:Transposase
MARAWPGSCGRRGCRWPGWTAPAGRPAGGPGRPGPLDAVEAARAALSGRAHGAAKSRDGNLLEDDIECWVVNARDVKNVPGRPKTDKIDSVWLCKLAERGMLRPSFIPARPQRQLRDLTRYRRTLTQERTREKQRAEKLLEEALLTEPPDVTAAQRLSDHGSGPPLWPESRDRQVAAAVTSASVLQKVDIRSRTGRLASPRCRLVAPAPTGLEHSCRTHDLRRHPNLQVHIDCSEKRR